MPLGRPAWRAIPAPIGCLLAAAMVGCGALPYTVRVVPREGEIRTRLEGNSTAPTEPRAASPAIEPRPTRDAEPGSATPSEAAPVRDEAVTRASATEPIDDIALPEGIPPFQLDSTPPERFSTPPPAVAPTSADPPEVKPPATPSRPVSFSPGDVREGEAPAEPPRPPQREPSSAGASPPPGEEIGPAKPADLPKAVPPTLDEPSRAQGPPPSIGSTSPIQAPAPVEPERPEQVWRQGIERLREVARGRAGDPRPGAPDWSVRERMLKWLADPEAEPIAGRAAVKGLVVVLGSETPAPNRAAEIREAVAALEAEAPLEIAELRLCRKVNGFGDIEPLDPAVRRAGQSVVLYCEMAGLSYEPSGGLFRSRLAAEVELVADGAETPAWRHSLGTVEDSCRRRRRDYYANYKFTLPESLPAGGYRLRLRERDLATDRVATSETALMIGR